MLFKKDEIDGVQKALIRADFVITARKFLMISLFSSFLLSFILGVMIYFYLAFDLATILVIFVLLFSLFSLLFKRLPKILSKSRANSIEADLPIAVRAIAIQLNMKVPFDVALQNTADSNYRCSYELRRVMKEVAGGASIPEALYNMAERVESTIVKKIIVQLVRNYEEGTGGEALKKIADDLLSIQKIKFREFSAQLSFLGLLFIALACIAPTLFLAYGLVASMFLDVKIAASDVWTMFVIVFPLVNILIILYIKIRTPELITETKEKFLSNREKKLIGTELKRFGINLNINNFFIILAFIGIILCALSIYFKMYFGVMLLFIPLVVYFIILYLIDHRAKEIENYLPDALFQVGALEQGVPIEKIIQNLSKSGYGPLSEEFAMVSRQISAGTNIESSLLGVSERNNSGILDRVIVLLNQCYKIGGDIQLVIRETAEDIFDLVALAKEQAAILAMQRYTILFGGCIIIPIILAFVINIISGLDYNLLNISSVSQVERQSLISATTNAAQAYLIIYTFLASLFIAHQEGRARKAVVYFLIFVGIAIFLFNFVYLNAKV
jgi:pilus assembly protein TadC